MLMLVYLALSVTLLWTCFCRAARMNKGNTKAPIRWSFAALMASSAYALFAPAWGYTPDMVDVVLMGGMAVVQVTTSGYWSNGVPRYFRHTATH